MLHVGTDHPFNPTVSLVETSDSPAAVPESHSLELVEEGAIASFAHLDFLFSPAQAATLGGTGAAKGDVASTTSTRNSKTYRRPPPYIVDSKNNYIHNNGSNNIGIYSNNMNISDVNSSAVTTLLRQRIYCI